jgi:hypothetical protein
MQPRMDARHLGGGPDARLGFMSPDCVVQLHGLRLDLF